MIYIDGRLITHNDSQGAAALYEIDPLTGNVVREVQIANAQNIDWEDIAYDDEYIYIGDFGNNNGTRTDLKIYRISRQAYLNEENTSVPAEIISFNYTDQIDFSNAPLATAYDAEALIAFGDSLYIFTKNWSEQKTSVYPVPKIPGNYELTKTDSLEVGAWVTGADICQETGRILLTAYTWTTPMVISISNYSENKFSEGEVQILQLQAPPGFSHQIEGVACINPNLFYITSEENFLGNAGLYKLDLSTLGISEKEENKINIHPNPASHFITITPFAEKAEAIIYNTSGKKIKSYFENRIDISHLPKGNYIIEIRNKNGQKLAVKKLIIER